MNKGNIADNELILNQMLELQVNPNIAHPENSIGELQAICEWVDVEYVGGKE